MRIVERVGRSTQTSLTKEVFQVKHIINGCPVDLRSLSERQIKKLIDEGADRLDRLQDELDSLHGELVRRGTNVIPLFGERPA